MAMENKRIIQLSTERTNLTSGDYVMVDSDADGSAKYRLDRLKETDTTLSVSGKAADAAATGQAINDEAEARDNADNALDKDIGDLKSALSDIEDDVYQGSDEREILNTSASLTRNNNPIAIGETLSSSNQYVLEVSFTNTLSHLSGIRLATSSSGSTQIETLSPNIGTTQNQKYVFIPTTDTATYIHIEFNSGYSRDNSATVKLTQINIQRETSFYKRDYVDGLAKHGNRYDKSRCNYSQAIIAQTGETIAADHRITTDYIYVSGYNRVNISVRTMSYAFYTENKTHISGAGVTNAGSITIPTNAHYVRFTFEIDYVDSVIITFDDETTVEQRSGIYAPDKLFNLNADKEIAANRNRNTVNGINIIENCTIASVYTGTAFIDYAYTGSASHEIVCVATDDYPDVRLNLTAESAVSMSGCCALVLDMYVEDSTKVTAMTLYAGTSSGDMGHISLDVSPIVTGWNHVRIPTYTANMNGWPNSCQYFVVNIKCSNACKIHLTGLSPVYKEKARIIVVDDHGYHNFLIEAYPQLKALGIPTTWGIQPGMIGTVNGEGGYLLTQEEINTLADDPYSEFSFHSWDGSSNASTSSDSNMTVMQKCIIYLRQHGLLPIHPWRSAWVQNTAANPEGIKLLLEGGASYNSVSNYSLFPFDNMYNIPRFQIHARNQSWFDGFFDTLEKTHCDVVVYTHSIVEQSENHINMTTAELEMFIDGCTTGVNEGWLEGTTFNRLMLEYNNSKIY